MAVLASHIVFVERQSRDGRDFVAVSRAVVAPGETIRIVAENISPALWGTPVRFVVEDEGGEVIHEDSSGTSFAGTATVSFSAPRTPGRYTVTVSARNFPIIPGTHEAVTGFTVSSAPPAPPEGEPPGFWEDIGSTVKTAGFVLLGALGLMVALQIAKRS